MNTIVDDLLKDLCKIIPILKFEKLPIGLNDTLVKMFRNGIYLDRERINIILSFWHLQPMSQPFYLHYFEDVIKDKEHFIHGLEKFIKEALWFFGDLENAYRVLIEQEDINQYFSNHQFNNKEFEKRLPWNMIQNIDAKLRGYLGYVSGERPYKQKNILNKVELAIQTFEENYENLKELRPDEISERILTILKEKDPDIKNLLTQIEEIESIKELDLFSSKTLDENKRIIDNTKAEIQKTIDLVEKLKIIGRENQEHYLRNIESIDVYVATSMRDDKEYIEMADFVRETFGHDILKSLNIRYFDPTLCYCDSRIDKGIIECLLVRSAKVTIYCAQEGDTFGKDSELAATLVQGKPAIVYVPNKPELDNRAKIFKEFHPLGLQIGVYDGVARGVIVVRSPEECAQVLYNTLTNNLKTYISNEQHGIVLREEITKSVVRVMSGWGLLASSFWNNFEKTKSPKSGRSI